MGIARMLIYVAFVLMCFPGDGLCAITEDGSMDRLSRAAQTQAKWRYHADDQLAKTDPEFSAITNNLIYGEILSQGSLTEKQQALVILASLVAAQNWDEIPQAVESALALGTAPLEIRETLYQCAPYAGVPRVKKALALAAEVLTKAGVSLPLANAGTVTESTRFQDGLAVQKKIFGAERIEAMQKNAPANQQALRTRHLSAWCFGDFYTRGALDLQMRELITFCAIVSLGGCNPQAEAHALANLTVGNTADNLIDALATMLPLIGYPRTLNGLGCVNAALAQKDETLTNK